MDQLVTRPAQRPPRLRHATVEDLTIRRRRAGKGFTYIDADGGRVTHAETLARIAALAVPPAYRDVRIAADPNAHLQAVGRDEMGRLQYRYHPAWELVSARRKTGRLADLVAALPRIRAAVASDLKQRDLTREKAIACALTIIDRSYLRVGCETYARAGGGRGTATLLKRDAVIGTRSVRLRFFGKGGKEIETRIEDPALARALRRIASLPGRRLLQYRDAAGRRRSITAADINRYLAEIAAVKIVAKDLRMLGANALAIEALAVEAPDPRVTRRRRQITAAMRLVSEHLANTMAVVRRSYVHTIVVEAFESGRLAEAFRAARASPGRRRPEAALRRLLGGDEAGEDGDEVVVVAAAVATEAVA